MFGLPSDRKASPSGTLSFAQNRALTQSLSVEDSGMHSMICGCEAPQVAEFFLEMEQEPRRDRTSRECPHRAREHHEVFVRQWHRGLSLHGHLPRQQLTGHPQCSKKREYHERFRQPNYYSQFEAAACNRVATPPPVGKSDRFDQREQEFPLSHASRLQSDDARFHRRQSVPKRVLLTVVDPSALQRYSSTSANQANPMGNASTMTTLSKSRRQKTRNKGQGQATETLKLPALAEEHLDVSTLETWLWDAACAIRGAADAPKFKDFILPLIFFRRLSDVLDHEFAAQIKEFGDEGVAREVIQADHEDALRN